MGSDLMQWVSDGHRARELEQRRSSTRRLYRGVTGGGGGGHRRPGASPEGLQEGDHLAVEEGHGPGHAEQQRQPLHLALSLSLALWSCTYKSKSLEIY